MTGVKTEDTYLTHQRLSEVYDRCARRPGSPGCTDVECWMYTHTLFVSALMRSREEVVRMLLSLHPGFRIDESGGGSVAEAIKRGNGSVWTGDRMAVERLVALGMGLGLVEFCAPREAWSRLPGGLPYIRIMITRHGVTVN